ncbi:MAG: DUF1971 domain-containing protein [Litoreibacter sp.]
MSDPGLPKDVAAYRETPVFTELSVPKGLLKDHRTAEGVWGLLTVISGTLDYIIKDRPTETVSASKPAVIYPGELHRVVCDAPVRFKIVFHR